MSASPSKIWYMPLDTRQYSAGDEVVDSDVDMDPAYLGDSGVRGYSSLTGALDHGRWHCGYCTVIPLEIIATSSDIVRCRTVRIGRFLTPQELDGLAGFKLYELSSPVEPLMLRPAISIEAAVPYLRGWARVWTSVRSKMRPTARVRTRRDSAWTELRQTRVEDIVDASVSWPYDYVEGMLENSFADVEINTWYSTEARIWSGSEEGLLDDADLMGNAEENVRSSVRDAIWAYVGGLFPATTKWADAEELGPDPWKPLLALWHAGYVPSFDGTLWRLYTGPKADIVWEGRGWPVLG